MLFILDMIAIDSWHNVNGNCSEFISSINILPFFIVLFKNTLLTEEQGIWLNCNFHVNNDRRKNFEIEKNWMIEIRNPKNKMIQLKLATKKHCVFLLFSDYIKEKIE